MKYAFLLPIFCLFLSISASAQSPFDYFEKGKQLQKMGRSEDAIAHYDECLKLDQKFAEAFFNRGAAHFSLGQYFKSIRDFTAVSELRIKDFEPLERIGNCYYMLLNSEKALEFYEKALEITPNSRLFISASLAASQIGNQQKAIDFAEKAIEIEPENPRGWAAKGAALSKNNQTEMALAAWREAESRLPNDAELLGNIGACLCKMGFWSEAEVSLTLSIKIEPNSLAFLNRSRAFLEQSKMANARADADAALQMSVDNSADAYNLWGLIFYKNKQLDSALVSFNNAIGWEPGHIEAIYNRSQAFYALGLVQDAESDLDILVNRRSQEGRVFYARARARYDLGKMDGACADFRQAQSLGLPEVSVEYQTSFCRN
jgi:tetratricopeptide (TPR) repeat protein